MILRAFSQTRVPTTQNNMFVYCFDIVGAWSKIIVKKKTRCFVFLVFKIIIIIETTTTTMMMMGW